MEKIILLKNLISNLDATCLIGHELNKYIGTGNPLARKSPGKEKRGTSASGNRGDECPAECHRGNERTDSENPVTRRAAPG